ncbi:protein fuzzy homolog isoform X2 [Zootermopsis nevadensis]|uniref:protein fuzzy homolog isoform X2 n=1 Tax=Zootermopsis nevadensis TaxID=136037 RepID=UPI000B8EC3C7|nr:protein fuzzy homolog isoform X2 [Zootermopsis nevadensis]
MASLLVFYLPFSVVASFNGVHMFGKSHSVVLRSTSTQETVILWKVREDSVTLIAAACGASEMLLDQLLTSVFHAMVLAVGINELCSTRNAERLKRELRICYPLVDHLLECVEATGTDLTATCNNDILGLVEVMLCPENHLLQSLVDAWAECMDSLYGFLLIRGCVAVATSSWWQLDPEEKKLLALLVSVKGTCKTCDIPVFLPCKSPAVPFRLIVCGLTGGIQICALCGPSPPLTEVEYVSIQCWKGAVDILRAAERCFPRNFPPCIQLDSGVLGILLVDRQAGKFLLSRNQCADAGKKESQSPSGAHRLDVLRTFYHQVADTFMNHSSDNSEGAAACEQPSTSAALETYWCSEYHKCHALRHGATLLCVLYASAVPIHTMRLITQRTLKFLTADKQLCW